MLNFLNKLMHKNETKSKYDSDENSSIADKTNTLAKEVNSIAEEIAEDSNKKKFA